MYIKKVKVYYELNRSITDMINCEFRKSKDLI